MKDLFLIELKSDLIYCQKKIKLAMAKLEVIENDEAFDNNDAVVLCMELRALFSNRVEKTIELEKKLEK